MYTLGISKCSPWHSQTSLTRNRHHWHPHFSQSLLWQPLTTQKILKISREYLREWRLFLGDRGMFNGCLKVFWRVQGCLGEMRLCKDALNGILVYFYYWVWVVSWIFGHFESIWKMTVAVDYPVAQIYLQYLHVFPSLLLPFWQMKRQSCFSCSHWQEAIYLWRMHRDVWNQVTTVETSTWTCKNQWLAKSWAGESFARTKWKKDLRLMWKEAFM